MINPPPLKPKDQIAIIATARKISLDELQQAIKHIEDWGYQAVIGSSIGKEDHQFAGSDNDRAEDLQSQINNPNIKAIWCARGGYGSVRILEKVDFSVLKTNLKWLIGYSDVTAIHAHLARLGIMSVHGQMALDVETRTEKSRESIRAILLDDLPNYTAKQSQFNRNGKASGKLIGGNLSVVYSLCGSPSALQPKGAVLFLEDLDEYLYHLDRMMQNLKRNGYFDHLKALVVGGMTDMNDNTIPFGKSAEAIIADTVAEFNFPVMFNFPSGHLEDNQAFIHGHQVTVEVTNQGGKLTYKHGTT